MARRAEKQLELPAVGGWGGARAGSGPKPRPGSGPSHVRREAHEARWPVHVTLRAQRGLPSLRSPRAFQALQRALVQANRAAFRVLHFSVQTDHLHLIVEGDSSRALVRGLQGLAGRCARALNRQWSRRGPVWSHRYHAHPLRTPTEVRRALAYVLLNFRKHLRAPPSIDPRSSGVWFDGWSGGATSTASPGPLSRPRTWLASVGWHRGGGPIHVGEVPPRRS